MSFGVPERLFRDVSGTFRSTFEKKAYCERLAFFFKGNHLESTEGNI